MRKIIKRRAKLDRVKYLNVNYQMYVAYLRCHHKAMSLEVIARDWHNRRRPPPANRRTGARWTRNDYMYYLSALALGINMVTMAKHMNRSYGAIVARYIQLGVWVSKRGGMSYSGSALIACLDKSCQLRSADMRSHANFTKKMHGYWHVEGDRVMYDGVRGQVPKLWGKIISNWGMCEYNR